MTTLKDFVKETLTQVVEGVAEFNSEQTAKNSGATTRPNPDMAVNAKDWFGANLMFVAHGLEGATYATIIDFDVAISTEEAEAGKAGGGIKVFSAISGEAGYENKTANSTVSRIKFSLPLQTS